MGSLHIKEGDDVWLVDVPTKKVSAEVIRSGDCVFIKYGKTKFRAHEFSVCRLYKTEQWAFPLCLKSWPWQRDFMGVLVKLGLMTRERQAELIEIDRERSEQQQRKYDLDEITKLAKRYGYKELDKVIEKLEAA